MSTLFRRNGRFGLRSTLLAVFLILAVTGTAVAGRWAGSDSANDNPGNDQGSYAPNA